MNYTEMSADELREARSAFGGEIETADSARLDEISAEIDAIDKEMETREAAEAKRKEVRGLVANGKGIFMEKMETNVKKVEDARNSNEYCEAYKRYVISEDARECRALLTENATNVAEGNSNTVPVPTFVDGRIRTAWEESDLLQYIDRSYIRGNVRIGYEVSATDAGIHAEGAAALAEEQLVLGTVELIPSTIKKHIRISDEVLDMAGREFVDYIYREITAKIIKALKAQVVGAIVAGTTAQTGITVPTVTGAPALDIVAQADALLSSEADNLCVIMNRATHPAFISAMAANGYMFDPFMNHHVIYDNTLPAYSAASSNGVWLIVGDLKGVHANFPNGDDVKLKYDDLSEAELDLVKIVGRIFVAIGLATPGRLAAVKKA